jgi:hypothetical protein
MTDGENTAPARPITFGSDRDKKQIETWKAELNTPDWLFAAARSAQNWPEGLELSEAEYSKATAAAEGEVIG